jgi:hypothetical protein
LSFQREISAQPQISVNFHIIPIVHFITITTTTAAGAAAATTTTTIVSTTI